jgi:serine/threonine protein kinase
MFKNKQFLADGTYGRVYKVNYNGKEQCLKEYKIPTDNMGVCEDILKEIFHSIQPYAKVSVSYISDNFKCIIMNLYDGDLYLYKSLYNIDINENCLKTIRDILLEQLYHLHSHGFLHSDVKMGNILFDKSNNTFTLCDFGLCEYYSFPCLKKKYICTEYFRAPTLGIRNNINFDIYSLGATLYYFVGNKFCEIIDKTKISSETIHDLINYNHEISAKNLLNITCKCEKKLKYINRIISKLNLKEEAICNNNQKLNDNIFLNLSIKNNVYQSYQFNNANIFEIEYLDDMYNNYLNHEFKFKNSDSDNIIYSKICLLKLHKHIKSHLDTLFFSWYLLDNIDFLNNIDSKNEIIIYFNFSCKLLEFNNIAKLNLFTNSILEVEYHLITKFINKELEFTPSIFYIYYFLYKIAHNYSNQYYIEYRILESIVLAIYTLYLLRPFKLKKNNTYVKLSYKIFLISIDFILKKKIPKKWEEVLKLTVSLIDNESLLLIIENNELRAYLTSNHK